MCESHSSFFLHLQTSKNIITFQSNRLLRLFINLKIIVMDKELINFSAREVAAHADKSQYVLVDTPLFRRLLCRKNYHHYEGVVFEQGKEYAVWITQCYKPADKKRRFLHYVAIPHHQDEGRLFYYIVPEEVFGEYEKGNIEVVTEIGGEKYKLINDFEGWGMLIPKWMFCRKRVREQENHCRPQRYQGR